jgi:glycosyltransferase involved in cell wall biosynthesis
MSQSLVFGYLGGDARWQGVDMLVDAANRLRDDRCDFLFVGLSTGSESVGRLHVLPPVPREATPSYYSACDVLVLPRPKHATTEVASPTKFAEYAAMGKPILTTDVGDPAALVRKYSCGIVVQKDTSDTLLQGLQEMLAKPKSELEQMGRQARILAEKEFDWGLIGARLDAALNEVVSI